MARAGRLGAVLVACLFGLTAGGALTAAPVFACDTSAPGTTCAPDSLATSTSSTLAASQSGTLDSCSLLSPPATCFNASFTEEVYRDPSNVFCANCLDWLIQLTDNTVPQSDTVDPIARVTIGNFSGWRTDQGTDSNAPPSGSSESGSGTAAPTGVSRDNSSTVLAWDFAGTSEIFPGQTTVILDVMTNATAVCSGQISAQDQSAAPATALGPCSSAVTPEVPATLLIVVVGGAAVGGFLYLRRRRTHTAPIG
jgi:hypothetical protein